MKVRCIRLLAPDGSPQRASPWLTVGKIYDVLTIELDRKGLWLLRLIGDRSSEVALFSIDAFEIVCSDLAPSWVISWTADGFFQLAPEAWLDGQFWERFYDRDPDAVRIFEIELVRIQRNHEVLPQGR